MSRDLPAAINAALTGSDAMRLALLVQMEFSSGTLRLWTGLGALHNGGYEWTGAGTLFGFDAIEETRAVVASGCTIYLSGVPTDLVSLCINDAQQGKTGRIYLAVLDGAGAVDGEPVALFSGRLDVPTINDEGTNCTISITYENRMIDLTTPREFRYTHESQQVLYPGDLGFEFVTAIQDQEIVWGRG
jgi:hypothetical protein